MFSHPIDLPPIETVNNKMLKCNNLFYPCYLELDSSKLTGPTLKISPSKTGNEFDLF